MNILNRLLELVRRGFGQQRQVPPSSGIDFLQLEQLLQYAIHQRHFFSEALTHRSLLQLTENESMLSNERLEFLGDAVLNLVVAEYLFRSHADAHEGDLTKIRSRLVNKKALGVYAREMKLGNFILMSPSTSQMEGKGMETILADAFEAVIGAIYLDGGFQQAKQFIERQVDHVLQQDLVKIEDENFKSQLLEHTQALGLGPPRYITINQYGPDHDRTFTIEVLVGDSSYGRGIGKNKKDAEQAAAEQAFLALQDSTHNNES